MKIALVWSLGLILFVQAKSQIAISDQLPDSVWQEFKRALVAHRLSGSLTDRDPTFPAYFASEKVIFTYQWREMEKLKKNTTTVSRQEMIAIFRILREQKTFPEDKKNFINALDYLASEFKDYTFKKVPNQPAWRQVLSTAERKQRILPTIVRFEKQQKWVVIAIEIDTTLHEGE